MPLSWCQNARGLEKFHNSVKVCSSTGIALINMVMPICHLTSWQSLKLSGLFRTRDRSCSRCYNQNGNTFESHVTHHVAATGTQIISYMIDSGLSYGYICMESPLLSFLFWEDPTIVPYFLCPKSIYRWIMSCHHWAIIDQVLRACIHPSSNYAEDPFQE